MDKQSQYSDDFVRTIRDSLESSQDWVEPIPFEIFETDWIQSLDDTPGKFTSAQTKEVRLRYNLESYLEHYYGSDEEAPSYTREQLQNLIPADDLRYFQCFDLSLDYHYNFHFTLEFSDLCDVAANLISLSSGLSSHQGVLDWLLGGYPWVQAPYPFPKSDGRYKLLRGIREKVFQRYQEKALLHLTDSVSFLGNFCVEKSLRLLTDGRQERKVPHSVGNIFLIVKLNSA